MMDLDERHLRHRSSRSSGRPEAATAEPEAAGRTAQVADRRVPARLARQRASRIRAGIHNYLETLAVIAEAYAERDHLTLGYDSWQSYVDEEFGAERLRLPPEHRQKAVAELRLAGMSQRAIGATIGVDAATVNRDLRRVADATPDEIRGSDGKTYAVVRERIQDHPLTPGEADGPLDVTGRDAVAREAPAAVAVAAGAAERPKPPKWDPDERRQHEQEVLRVKDIEAARQQAKTLVPDVRALLFTVLQGSRQGAKGLVTRDMITDLRKAVDLLEGEIDDEE